MAAHCTTPITRHVADLVLRNLGYSPTHVRALAGGAGGADDEAARSRARGILAGAECIAAEIEPHLMVFREMVEVAEAHGWDFEPGNLLDRAREAHAALTGFDNTKPDATACEAA